jgi:hypothetical protein
MTWNSNARAVRTWPCLVLLACALGAGCKLDNRQVESLTPDGDAVNAVGNGELGGAAGAGTVAPGENPGDPDLPLAGQGGVQIAAGVLGAACQGSAECAGGNCVDGVCCDTACADLCAACNVPGSEGTCSAAASDPLCPEANCQGQSSECRPLAGGQGGLNCEAIGTCRATADCAAMPAAAGMPCQAGTGTCDGQGACVVPDKSALGVACTADEECAEGHCVASGADGARVCCDAACDGVCQACSAAGRCEVTPATDARCTAVTCPADNACRNYVDSITDNLCKSFGQCRTALDCGTPEFFTALLPDAQCVCDPATGGCTLATGSTCAADGECASGACGATAGGNRLCCSGACAPGLFCSSTGTGCVQCEGSDVQCNGNVQSTCNAGAIVTTACANGCTPGAGCNDLPPVGFACNGGTCAGTAVCQQDTGGASRCCVRNCAAEGKVCSPTGSCDCPPGQVASGNSCLRQAGDPCQSTAQCQAGQTCVDGVCCQEACGGFCERCQAGTGLCAAVAAGQQELDPASGNNCSNGFVCTGARNGCKATTGQPCSNADGSGCVSGACEATAGGGALVCCSQACGNGLSCRSTGQGCVQCESAAQCANGCNTVQGICNPLKGNGESCSVASQCGSNACIQATDSGSRCCTGCQPGQQCSPQGTCISPQSPLGGRCTNTIDCQRGVCTNGLCCNESCDAQCESCGSDGECRSNNRCASVDCGGNECFINGGNVCCVRNARPGFTDGSLSFECTQRTDCSPDDATSRPISCDDPSDCSGGTVCCHDFPATYAGETHCLPVDQCNTSTIVNLTTFEQICASPSFSDPSSCNPGFFGDTQTMRQRAICSVVDTLPGWMRCTLDFNNPTL